MFGTIRRHQTWLWVIIAGFTIVSFIVYFNPMSRSGGMRSRSGQTDLGSINGEPITQEQYENAQNEYILYLMLMNRKADLDTAETKYEVYKQMFFSAQQERLGIHPTAQAAGDFARSRILGNTISYDDFVDKKLKPLGLTADDFDRFLRHQVGSEQMRILGGVNGLLVTPGEAETLYRSEHRALVTKMAWFAASNYIAAVTIPPGALQQFFTNELANYRVPERVQVDYVKYDLSNYLAAARTDLTNLDGDVDNYFAQHGISAVPDAKTPEQAKARIREEMLKGQALLNARRAAGEFAVDLDQSGNHASDLAKLAQAKGLTVHTTPAFDEENGPEGLNVPDVFVKDAFQLTPDAGIGADIYDTNAVYIIALKQRLPSTIPAFSDVEAKVTADYRLQQAYTLAQTAATNFTTALTNEMNVNNGVTLTKTFADICAETGVKAESVPPFSLSTTNVAASIEDRVDLATLKRAGFNTPVGSASTAVDVHDGFFVLYVEKMLPVDEVLLQSELPKFTAYMREVRENDAYNLWLNFQISKDPSLIQKFQELNKAMRETAPTASR